MRTLPMLLSIPIVSLAIAGCSDGSDPKIVDILDPEVPLESQPKFDFSAVDQRLQQFLDESAVFDGISITLVDKTQGMVHEAAFGDHTLDTIVMLASTSKVPTVSLLMALNDDESLEFDVQSTIDNYLPWEGVYGDRTSVHLVSNTAGIPGLGGLRDYGPSLCQFAFDVPLLECAETLYANEIAGTMPPATGFSYGGTQWQLAGAVVEQVSNSTFNQAFDEYIGQPCGLEVFEYGNPWSALESWNGSPDSLIGRVNAHSEGGAITNLGDYAKILMMHLNGGMCGDTQVMAASSVAFMQVDRGGEFGTPYGMGWWIMQDEEGGAPTIFTDPGAFGAISWLDIERGIGGYVAIDEYARVDSGAPIALVQGEIIQMVADAVDAAIAADN
jgi:CubicO group peptidase (beta-lactamase class C family)